MISPTKLKVGVGVGVYWCRFFHPYVRPFVSRPNLFRSVSFIILAIPISYLHILSANFRRCTACHFLILSANFRRCTACHFLFQNLNFCLSFRVMHHGLASSGCEIYENFSKWTGYLLILFKFLVWKYTLMRRCVAYHCISHIAVPN